MKLRRVSSSIEHPLSLQLAGANILIFFFLVDVFTGIASVDHDFIRVDVETSSGETKSDVHMHVFPKKEVLERPTKPGGIPLNVALIMFDSTSAANFRRKMPNSLEYLTKNLDSLLMQGKHFTTSFPGPSHPQAREKALRARLVFTLF